MNARFLLVLALLSSTPFALAQTSSSPQKSTTSSSARKSGEVVHQDFGQIKADRHDADRTAATTTSATPAAAAVHKEEIKPRDASTGMPTGRRMAKPDGSPTPTTPQDAARIKSHSNQSNNRTANTSTTATPQDAAKIKSHSNQTNN